MTVTAGILLGVFCTENETTPKLHYYYQFRCRNRNRNFGRPQHVKTALQTCKHETSIINHIIAIANWLLTVSNEENGNKKSLHFSPTTDAFRNFITLNITQLNPTHKRFVNSWPNNSHQFTNRDPTQSTDVTNRMTKSAMTDALWGQCASYIWYLTFCIKLL